VSLYIQGLYYHDQCTALQSEPPPKNGKLEGQGRGRGRGRGHRGAWETVEIVPGSAGIEGGM
jgi:hypothetical protein